ncbi:MAG: hypothetical protein U0446_01955 [Dehalococcoidia bacterium]
MGLLVEIGVVFGATIPRSTTLAQDGALTVVDPETKRDVTSLREPIERAARQVA